MILMCLLNIPVSPIYINALVLYNSKLLPTFVNLSIVGHVMVLYSPDWTNIRFSFILLTVNLFRHPTLIEHGLYLMSP